MAGTSGDSPSLLVARRFLEQRRNGQRVSIDAVMDGIPNVGDRTLTRAEALRTISMEVQASGGISQAPGTSFDRSHDLFEVPKLDGYDLIDMIGQGGMGRVYEGYQHSTGRRVAIKFLLEYSSATESARHRFEREVELVVRLQHPNIVSVLDSGIHKGRYYYVMEYVDGSRLDEAFPPGECDVHEAMRTMQQICQTVDYAHQRGVLHRDLKPSNIMVDQRGEPHILDFGLAKGLDAHGGIEMTLSQPGQLLGTLGYMSPEQSQGRMQLMSVRSDVYSLGAITYELLTGELPCDTSGPLNISLTNIVEQEPRKPSAIRGKLDADANAIVLKALEKVPDNRYATAGEFAADIGRFLANESITARRPSLAARTARWVRRNRAVATVGCVSFLAVVAITTVAFIRILRERDMALENLALLNDTFLSPNPDRIKEVDEAMAPVINYLARKIDTAMASQPEKRADLHDIVGEVYKRRGDYEKSLVQFETALEQRIELYGQQHPAVAECHHNIGSALYFLHRYEASKERYEKALEMRTRLLGPRDESVFETKHHLASVYRKLGELARDEGRSGDSTEYFSHADRYYHQALDYRIAKFGEFSKEVAHARNNLALFLLEVGDSDRYSEAQGLIKQAIETFRNLPEDEAEPSRAAESMQNLGKCYMKQGMFKEADEQYLQALAEKEKLRGRDTETAALTLHSLAGLRKLQGRFNEAATYCHEALQIRKSKLNPDHKDVLASRKLLAEIEAASGTPDSLSSE